MTERHHYSEYNDKLQIRILEAIQYLRRRHIPVSEDKLDQLMDASSNSELEENVQGVCDIHQFQLSQNNTVSAIPQKEIHQ